MTYVAEIGSLMEDMGMQPLGLLGDSDFLPRLRAARERVTQ